MDETSALLEEIRDVLCNIENKLDKLDKIEEALNSITYNQNYDLGDLYNQLSTVESTVESYRGVYRKQDYSRVQADVQYTYNDDGSVSAYISNGHYEYVGASNMGTTDGDFYQLFYGSKKSVYENAGYSFGDIFKTLAIC